MRPKFNTTDILILGLPFLIGATLSAPLFIYDMIKQEWDWEKGSDDF